MQIHDLVRSYESKSDEELLLLANNAERLTLEARTALQSELSRRGVHNQIVAPRITSESQSSREHSSAVDFVASVARLYRSNFWLFVKLVGPAVVVGFLAITLARNQAREIVSHLPRGLELLQHRAELAEVWLLNLTGGFISWLAFCVAFAGICSAVAQVRGGVSPRPTECFAELRYHLGAFARVCILLYILFLLALGISFLLMIALWTLFGSHFASPIASALSYAFSALLVLVLARFGLAIPAVLLGDCNARASMFRSDELTMGKWLILTALLTKSIGGGYIAGMLPFWVAGSLWTYIQVPAWILTVLSIAGVIVTEPFMFIGFSLLYIESEQPCAPERPIVVNTN